MSVRRLRFLLVSTAVAAWYIRIDRGGIEKLTQGPDGFRLNQINGINKRRTTATRNIATNGCPLEKYRPKVATSIIGAKRQ